MILAERCSALLRNQVTHLVPIRIEECFQVYHIGMADQPHDLQFSVLWQRQLLLTPHLRDSHLESLILQHLLDSDLRLRLLCPIVLLRCWTGLSALSRISSSGLTQHICRKDHSKAPIPHDLTTRVGDGDLRPCLPRLRGNSDDPSRVIGCNACQRRGSYRSHIEQGSSDDPT